MQRTKASRTFKDCNIAVEHGSFHNTGDVAMLYNVLRKLKHGAPGSRIEVRLNDKEPRPKNPDIDNTFKGLQPYFTTIRDNTRCAKAIKCFPTPIRLKLMQMYVILAVIRLVFAALVFRSLGTMLLCPHLARDFLETIHRSSVFFVAGHGGVTEYWLYETVYALHTEMIVAHLLGTKVIASGQGVGPLNARLGRIIVALAFKFCHLASVRDRDSLDFLRKIGVKGQHVVAAGDDACDLPYNANEVYHIRTKLLQMFPSGTKRLCAFNVRVKASARKEPWDMNIPLSVIRKVLEEVDMGVIMVPMLTHNADEIEFHEKLSKSTDPLRCQVIKSLGLQPESAKETIAACDIAVGYPYHFLLFALSTGVPAIALCETPYYRKKLEGLMDLYETGLTVLDPKNIQFQHQLDSAFEMSHRRNFMNCTKQHMCSKVMRSSTQMPIDSVIACLHKRD